MSSWYARVRSHHRSSSSVVLRRRTPSRGRTSCTRSSTREPLRSSWLLLWRRLDHRRTKGRHRWRLALLWLLLYHRTLRLLLVDGLWLQRHPLRDSSRRGGWLNMRHQRSSHTSIRHRNHLWLWLLWHRYRFGQRRLHRLDRWWRRLREGEMLLLDCLQYLECIVAPVVIVVAEELRWTSCSCRCRWSGRCDRRRRRLCDGHVGGLR
jgi:hypothetical protein